MKAKDYLTQYQKLREMLDTCEMEDEEKALALKKMREIKNTINKLNKPMSSILLGKYIGGKSLKKVSREIGYNYDYVRHKHRDALKRIEKFIK